MGHEIKSGFVGYVLEMAVPVVLKENIPFIDGGDIKILVPTIVDITKGRSDADAAFHTHAGLLGDIFKFSIAEIPPQFVATELADKVNVVQSIAIHIGDGDAGAVVIVDGHVITRGVDGGVFTKSDSAFLELVGEMKSVEHLELVYRIELRFFATPQAGKAGVILRESHHGRSSFLGRQPGAEGTGKY